MPGHLVSARAFFDGGNDGVVDLFVYIDFAWLDSMSDLLGCWLHLRRRRAGEVKAGAGAECILALTRQLEWEDQQQHALLGVRPAIVMISATKPRSVVGSEYILCG